MSLYETLNVPPDADADTIKKAYRVKAQQTHPDKEDGDADEFKKVSHAYEVLSNPQKRERYDSTGAESNVPTLHEKAMQCVADLLVECVTKLDVKHQDILMVAVKQVNGHREQMLEEKSKTKKQIKKREEAMKRVFRKNGADNKLLPILQKNITAMKMKLISIEEGIQVTDEILLILDDYRYTTDERPKNRDGADAFAYMFGSNRP